MKKLILSLALSSFIFLAFSQTSPKSYLRPYDSNGYITWNSETGYYYLVNYYLKNNGVLLRDRVVSTEGNYYRFSFQDINTDNLFFTISQHNSSNGRKTGESEPAPASMNGQYYNLETTCITSCDNPREAYGIYRVQDFNSGVSGLICKEGYRDYNWSTGAAVPFYQAIDIFVWNQIPQSHPYKQQGREKYPINMNTQGGPFFDAQNSSVTSGWLVRKELDEYAHFYLSSTFEAPGPNNNYQQTPGYQPDNEFCDGNIGYAIDVFNNHVNPSTVMPISSSQYPFLMYNTVNGQPVYITPNLLTCVTGYTSTSDHEFEDFEDVFTDDFFNCSDDYFSDANPSIEYGQAMLSCVELALGDIDPNTGVIGGTVENVNSEFPYSLNFKSLVSDKNRN